MDDTIGSKFGESYSTEGIFASSQYNIQSFVNSTPTIILILKKYMD